MCFARGLRLASPPDSKSIGVFTGAGNDAARTELSGSPSRIPSVTVLSEVELTVPVR